jgi:integrase/recombinase XerD
MSNAGLRISEVIDLQLSDLHLDDGYIHVFGKGQKHRKVKVGGRLVAKINAWLSRMPASIEGTLVTDDKGLSIGREQAWKRFTAIAEKAGVNTTPHAMRHTFVLRFMDAVMNGDPSKMPAAIDAVCQQTGDRPEVILAYYTRARESDMRAAAEVM